MGLLITPGAFQGVIAEIRRSSQDKSNQDQDMSRMTHLRITVGLFSRMGNTKILPLSFRVRPNSNSAKPYFPALYA